jgi:hypothetical protein
MGDATKPVVEGVGDGVTALGKAHSGIGHKGKEAQVRGHEQHTIGLLTPERGPPRLRIRPEEAMAEVRYIEQESVWLQIGLGAAPEGICMVPWATAHSTTASIGTSSVLPISTISWFCPLSALHLTIHFSQDAVNQHLLRDVFELSQPNLLHEKAAFDTPGRFRANEDHPTFAKRSDPRSDIGHWP